MGGGGNAMGLNGRWGGVVGSVRPRAEPGQGLTRILTLEYLFDHLFNLLCKYEK